MSHIDSTLYEIANELLAVHEQLESPDMQRALDENDGEIPSEIAAQMDAIEMRFETKIENCGAYASWLDDQIELYSGWIRTRQRRLRQLKKRLQWFKEYARDQMDKVGKAKVEGALGNYGVRMNPERVVVDDVELIPDVFLVPQPPKVVLNDIKAKLRSKVPVPGAHLERTRSFYYPKRKAEPDEE